MSRRRAPGLHWGRWGSWDTHGELVDFIYWFLTFSFWFFLNFPPPQVQQW